MELSSFVRIFDGDQFRGTGYRLSRDRVLTALHVVRGVGDARLELERGDKVEASVLWSGDLDSGLDAAVLACEPGEGTPVDFAHLAREPLSREARWSSWGCPMAGTPGEIGRDAMEPLSGTAYPKTEHEDRLKLIVDAWPSSNKGWQGISGAPVFIDDRIHGVIHGGPLAFEGRRIYATPIHRLLAAEGFAEAVGLTDTDKWQGLLGEIRRLLKADLEACSAIAGQVPRWQEILQKDGSQGLASALERTPLEEVLEAMHYAHRELARKGLDRPAVIVERILGHVVPFLCERQLVLPLSESGDALLRIPVATSTLAEIVLAGADARAFQFRPLTDAKASPDGKARLPRPPEVGMDPDGKWSVREFVEHLAGEVVDEEILRRLRRLPDEAAYAQMAQILQGHFARQAKDGLRHYFLFFKSEARDYELFLAPLRRDLSALRWLELEGEDIAGEWVLLQPLKELLYEAYRVRNVLGKPRRDTD